MASRESTAPPWKRENPKRNSGRPPTRLTTAEKDEARARARRAGRRYPNLVDNLNVAKERTARKHRRRPAAKPRKK